MKCILSNKKKASPPPLCYTLEKKRVLLHPVVLCFAMFMLMLPVSMFAQQQPLFTYHAAPALTQQQQQKAGEWIHQAAVKHYEYVTISKNFLFGGGLLFNFKDGRTVAVAMKERIERANNMYSWFGKFDSDKGNLSLVIKGENITGTYHTVGTKIQLIPIGAGMHVLLWLNSTVFPQDETDQGYQQMLQLKKSKMAPATNAEATNTLADGSDCKVRILVAYTDDVAASLVDVHSFIQSCIDITNIAYNNSIISFDVELARSIEVNYAESGYSGTDLSRFQTNGDGYMDEVFNARTYYDADLCALIVHNLSDACGLASTIKASYDEAFCVVAQSCAVDNYSFPHELGHLYGCRHDQGVDNTSTPYPYGHGYVYPPGNWRTIMAYATYCSGCDRLGYFSNPDVTYGGVAMGTAATNDNESVHENEAHNVAQLEPTITDKFFPAETIKWGEIGDVLAATSVTNASAYVIQSGAYVTWRAGSSLTLAPGFTAAAGSSFRAYFDGCSTLDLGDQSPMAKTSTVQTTNIASAPNMDSKSGIKLYPNPASSYITVQSVHNIEQKSCYLSDISGKRIPCIWKSNSNTLDISRLASGIYFLNFIDRGKLIHLKFVKQ